MRVITNDMDVLVLRCVCVVVDVAAAATVMQALAEGDYSDDAELAFIQCFLQDERLQALLGVSLREDAVVLFEHRWRVGAILVNKPVGGQHYTHAHTAVWLMSNSI